MVNFEKLAAVIAALNAGNTEKAQSIVHGEKAAALAKRADSNSDSSAASAWINEEGTPVPKPSNDAEFYTFLTPDDVGQYELGDIIKHREVGVYNASSGYKAYQFLYRSENSTGFPVGALTTIVVPDNNDGKHVVFYPQPEDSAYINCASSYELLTEGFDSDMEKVLAQGWVLAVPDHQGFNSSFTAGILEGKLTLDSIRALEKSRNVTGIDNNKYAVTGYSGGSVAAGWAAELQESYAPDLNIVAYSLGGYVNNLTDVIYQVNKEPSVGFVPGGIMGLASEYPQMWDLWGTEITGDNATSLEKALSQCVVENILYYAGKDVWSFFKSGSSVLENDIIAPILKNNTLKQHTPKVPMLIYNGVDDEIVPVESVDEAVEYYCSNGASLVYYRGENETHTTMNMDGFSLTFDFFLKAFDGTFPSGCTFVGAAPDFASEYTGSYDGSIGSESGSDSSESGTGSSESGSSASESASESGSSESGSSESGSSESGSSESASESGSPESGSSESGSSSTANLGSYIQPASLGLISLLFNLL